MLRPKKETLEKAKLTLEEWNKLADEQQLICPICDKKLRKPTIFQTKLVCAFHLGVQKRLEKYKEQWDIIISQDKRACVKCGIEKRLNEFPIGRKRRDGTPRYAYCKTCHTAYQRVGKLKNFFKIDEQEYKKILEFQSNVCAICKNPPKNGKNLAIDHDHKTGLIRGLLCNWCNRVLGVIRDDLERARRMAKYLEAPPAVKVIGERFGMKGRTSNKKATIERLNKNSLLDRPKDTNGIIRA